MLRILPALDAGVARSSSPQLVLIAAGTPITCEFGHAICVTASDLHAGEPLTVEMFTRWQHASPQAGDSLPPCSICGGAGHRERGGGIELHTPEGWRSLKGSTATTIATKEDVENGVALLDAKIEKMARRFETALWKHTLGIILNVLVIGALIITLYR
jgi:hypothetical protein